MVLRKRKKSLEVDPDAPYWVVFKKEPGPPPAVPVPPEDFRVRCTRCDATWKDPHAPHRCKRGKR